MKINVTVIFLIYLQIGPKSRPFATDRSQSNILATMLNSAEISFLIRPVHAHIWHFMFAFEPLNAAVRQAEANTA